MNTINSPLAAMVFLETQQELCDLGNAFRDRLSDEQIKFKTFQFSTTDAPVAVVSKVMNCLVLVEVPDVMKVREQLEEISVSLADRYGFKIDNCTTYEPLNKFSVMYTVEF